MHCSLCAGQDECCVLTFGRRARKGNGNLVGTKKPLCDMDILVSFSSSSASLMAYPIP